MLTVVWKAEQANEGSGGRNKPSWVGIYLVAVRDKELGLQMAEDSAVGNSSKC
jgi:hypothetical protein